MMYLLKFSMLLVFYLLFDLSICHAGKTVVILSRSLAAYEDAWHGFSDSGLIMSEIHNMDGNSDNGQRIMTGLIPDTTDLVVTIGLEATTLAKQYVTTIPVVYSMVLKKQELNAPLSTGVLSHVPLEKQLDIIHKMFPQKSIGVIYDLNRSKETISEARNAAKALGATLAPIAIETADDISYALKKITADNTGVFWLMLDPTVAQPQSVQLIIQHCLKEKIPFLGLSIYHVKAGAFGALSVNFKDIGIQTAELAKKVIESKTAPPTAYPRSLVLYINEKTKTEIGIDTIVKLPNVLLVIE